MCRYDLDDVDLYWLRALNRELDHMGRRRDHVAIIHEMNLVLIVGQRRHDFQTQTSVHSELILRA